MDEIMAVRLLIGDVPTSPFYQLFTDEEIQYFLDLNSNDIKAAARMAAISASLQLAGWATRERVGDIEVWNSLSSNYLKGLSYLISDSSVSIPNGLMPWAGGISKAEICANDKNLDAVQSPLSTIHTCDDLCEENYSFTN